MYYVTLKLTTHKEQNNHTAELKSDHYIRCRFRGVIEIIKQKEVSHRK